MRVSISPGAACGVICAPASKSEAHRALICAALTDGSAVRNVTPSGDVDATLRCLASLGAKIERRGDTVTLGGLDPKNIKDCTLDCGESGSTLRFLIPLCMISGARVTFTGTEKLLSRPLDEYETLAAERGFTFEKGKDLVTVSGKLTPGDFDVSMAKSSQFMTGLLFALAAFDEESRIRTAGRAESVSYAKMTADILRKFGAAVTLSNGVYTVRGALSANDFTVGGDFSNASFLDALNFVGGAVTVTGLDKNSAQGDRVYPGLFKKIKQNETVDLSDCPDLAPVLFALAAYVGYGSFVGTKRLKYKESDRAAAMREELSALGVTLDIKENAVTVSGRLTPPCRALSSHNDHRIAMALSVLLTVTGGTLDGAEAVSKSYPRFFDDLRSLGTEVNIIDA